MAFERELHRAASGEEGLDLDLEREKAARLKRKKDAELAARVPGKRTLVEQLPVPPEAPASVLEYRARGMRDVVSTMGAIARGERSGVLQTTPAMGETMMRVADRRAHTLMRRAQDHGDVDAHDPAVEESLAQMGGGAPLPEKLRKKMEAEFGVSFDRVRVHTDGVAAQAAAAVHAEAFTVGEDIFFAEGAFDPASKSGQHLIAHELTHVVQGMEGRVAAAGGVSKPGESLETEAERRAETVVARGSTPRVAPVRPQQVEAPRAPRTVVVAPAPAAAPGVHSAPIMRRPAAGVAPNKKGKGKGKITVQATRDPNDKIPHIQHEGRAKLGEAKSRLDQATHGAKAHANNAIAQAHAAASTPKQAASPGDEHKDLAHAVHKGHEHAHKAHAPHHPTAHHDESKSGDKNAGTGGIKLKPVGDWEKLAPPALPDQDEREKKKILGLVKHKVEKDRAKSAKLLSSLKAAQLKASSGIAAMKGGLQSEIAGAQRAALGKVSSAEAAQVASVQSHIAGLQAQVRGAASAAVASVDQAHQQTIAQMAQAFAQANQKLAQDHTQALAKLQADTTAELTAVSTQFEEAESSIRAYGGQKASEASAMGDMALSYSGDQLDAARKAAHEVAEKYAAAMPENANQAAEQVGKSLPDAQDAVRHTSDAFKEQIETAFNQAKDALQTQHQQMVQAANQAHQQSVASIRQASSAAISALGALQSQTVAGLHSQAASARAGISSAGAAAIAGVGSTCDKAAAGLKGGAEGVIQAAAKMETPDPRKLGLEVAKARKELSKGAAAAAAGMKKSASSSAASLAQQATSAAGGLAQAASAANTSASQQAQAAEQGIRQTAQQATQAQHKIGEEFKKTSTKLVTQTQTGFEQANEHAKSAFEKQTSTLEGKLKGFVDGCKGKLDEAVPGKERPDILAQAAKAAASVPKHWWQKVVSFVVKVVIAVAIGVAVGALIVATGGVGGVLLAVAIGAAGGALGYTASLVAGNLIEGKAAFDNFSWKGLAVAAVAGGLTAGATSALGSLASGATSGFLGAFAEGASGLGNFAIKTATDFGISMVSDAIAQKAITGEYKVTLEDVLLTAATAGISNSTKLVGGAHEGGSEGGGEHGGGAGDLDVGGGHGGEGGSNEGGHGGGSNETQHAGGANDNAAGAKGGADEAKSGGGAGETNAKGANEGAANDNAGAGKGGKGGADEAKAGANDNANAKGAGENKGGANEKTGGGEKGGADEAKSGTNEKGGGENKSGSNEKGKSGGEDEKAGASDKSSSNENKGANDNDKGKGGEDEKAGASDKSGSNEKGKAGEDEKAGANDNGKDKAANDNEKGKGGEDEKTGGDKSESNKKGEHEGNEDQKEGGEGEGGKKKVFDKHKAHEKLDEALHPKTKGQKLEDVAKVGEKTSDVLKDKGREDAEEKKKEKEEEEKSEKETEEHSHPEMPELEISEKELEEDGYAAANPSTFARAVGSIASGRAPDLKELRDTQANREGRAELEKMLSNPNLSPEQKQKLQADLAARLSNGAAPSGNIKRELAAVRQQEKQAGNESKDETESEETPVQRKATAPAPAGGIQAAAAEGVQGPGGRLPHLDQIQRSFGEHDVSGVQAHVGGAAATASAQLGAEAYAHGNSVAFAGQPDLHTAAHEAAHVVQQRGGVQLKGGIDGGASDPYEKHADAVADKVVRGESASSLLASGAGGGTPAVQRKPDPNTAAQAAGAASAATPAAPAPAPYKPEDAWHAPSSAHDPNAPAARNADYAQVQQAASDPKAAQDLDIDWIESLPAPIKSSIDVGFSDAIADKAIGTEAQKGAAAITKEIDAAEKQLHADTAKRLTTPGHKPSEKEIAADPEYIKSKAELERTRATRTQENLDATRQAHDAAVPNVQPGQSVARTDAKQVARNEGKALARTNFMSWAIDILGSASAVKAHFTGMATPKGHAGMWLAAAAKARLEAAEADFQARNPGYTFPDTDNAMALRGMHQQRWGVGMLGHALGEAFDFLAIDNPNIKIDDNGHSHAYMIAKFGGQDQKRGSGRATMSISEKDVEAVGAKTVAGVTNADTAALVANVTKQFDEMVQTSERFKASMAPQLKLLQDARNKYFDQATLRADLKALNAAVAHPEKAIKDALKDQKFDNPGDKEAFITQVKADLQKRAQTKAAELKQSQDDVNAALEAAFADWSTGIQGDIDDKQGKIDANQASRDALTNEEKLLDAIDVAVEGAMDQLEAFAVEHKLTPSQKMRFKPKDAKAYKKALATELKGRNQKADAPLKKFDTDAHADLKELQFYKDKLKDPAFVFGPGVHHMVDDGVDTRGNPKKKWDGTWDTKYDASKVPLMQLIEHGTVRNDAMPERAAGGGKKGVYNADVVATLAKFGWAPGANFGDTMHFDFIEGYNKAVPGGRSPENMKKTRYSPEGDAPAPVKPAPAPAKSAPTTKPTGTK